MRLASTTIVASVAMPVRELDKGVSQRIGVEDSGHQHEEVVQSPLFESRANRILSFPFAQMIVSNVGMGHTVVARGPIGSDRRDLVVVGRASRPQFRRISKGPRSMSSSSMGGVRTESCLVRRSHWKPANCSSRATRSR